MSTTDQTTAHKTSEGFFRLNPLVAAVRVVIAGGLFVGPIAPVQADLPIPGVDAGHAPGGVALPWLQSGSAEHHMKNDNTMVIDQHTTHDASGKANNNAILNWQGFNVGADKNIVFNQPDGSSVILNRIFQQDASVILGHITANGQIYLVNNNGFVFGNGSVIDAGSLVASALNISSETINNGIVAEFNNTNTASTTGSAALGGTQNPSAGDQNTAVNPNALIKVESGASIHVNKNGEIILAAPAVSNSGTISADKNGQIILVASQDKVYLQPASSTSPFAGLLVEVGKGGRVSNNAKIGNNDAGNISVREGNVTLAGFAVNQSGRISATTSVNVNGSVRLLARENADNGNVAVDGAGNIMPGQTVRSSALGDGLGTNSSVTLSGSNSSIQILPDADGGSAITEQKQPASYVEVNANKIDMQSGASIVAPGGNVNLTAVDNNNLQILAANASAAIQAGNSGRIDLENGSLIDVSGLRNVQLAMSSNVADVSVQSFNLRDAPYQRGGVLQGQTVQVDVRNLPSIIDASGAPAGIKHSIEERLTTGGNINLKASGDVVVNSGAVTNIAGGSVTYLDGYINTTKLIDAAGRVVDISQANPDQHYTGIFGTVTEKSSKWGTSQTYHILGTMGSAGQFEQGYTEGKAAGSLNVQSPLLAWDGQLKAGTQNINYNPILPVSGGTFSFNQGDNHSVGEFLSAQNVSVSTTNQSVNIGIDDAFPQTNNQPIDLTLSTALLNQSGISNLIVKTGGNISVANDAALAMPAMSRVELDASSINVNGSIHTSGGTVKLNSILVNGRNDAGVLDLASTSQINVSGSWVNDFQNGLTASQSAPKYINAGTVSVNAGSNLNFNTGATIKADGGAWLNSTGRLTAGNAGNISLAAGTSTTTGSLLLHGDLSAYGLNKGGNLSLSTIQQINIGSSIENNALNLAISNGNFNFAPSLSFSTINLNSTQNNIKVDSNTSLSLAQQNRMLDANYQKQASSDSIAKFSHVTTLTENLRNSLNLNLTGYSGVSLETGSAIHLDKGSSIKITASNDQGPGIYIDGLIDARAGSIDVEFKANKSNYDPTQSIWLGSHADLNTQGTARLNPVDALGRTTGVVLSGGNVTLNAQSGYVVMQEGSKINVSGSRAQLDVPTGFQFTSKTLGSSGGTISITSAEGMVLDGSFNAKAGSSGNSGGSLNLTLDRNNRQELIAGSFPDNILQFNVVQNLQSTLPGNSHFGLALPDSSSGQATISSSQVAQAGFDNLQIKVPYQTNLVQGQVQFHDDVMLKTGSSINIDAPAISWAGANAQSTGTVTLDSPYLQLGSTSTSIIPGSPVTGGGSLITDTTDTKWIQLNGALSLTEFKQVSLNSKHDLRAVGVMLTGQRTDTGELRTAANLDLNASQIYPSTLTNYTFSVIDKYGNPSGQIGISGNNTDVTPLSTDGQLTFNAAVINQNGVIKAPLGSIAMNATTSLSFGKDSVTSVSADGKTIPFGVISNNLWEYPLTANSGNLVFDATTVASGSTPGGYISAGVKTLSFKSPVIQFNTGSTVNVSGGGDLLAAEFQPGSGGSNDYLANSTGFAILPSLGSSLAPYDPYLSANFAHDPRTTVYLSGTGSLAAGYYTILPTRYALLPGAYLVTPQANTQDQTITTTTTAGLPVVSGFETVAGTNIRDSRLSGFMIETSAQVQQHSQYNIQTANSFFANGAASKSELPRDSGQISIDASTQLVLNGTFKVAAANGGKGAKMDISAPNINVVNSSSNSLVAGTLELLDQQLNNLHVDSLLLGGTRQLDNSTGITGLTVSADNVNFESGVSLQAPELIAAAKNTVEVKNGATITSSGTVNTGESQLSLTGDSALLRVSADNQITVHRASAPGLAGRLLVDQGAVLNASKSMLLDASKSTVLNGDIAMQGGSLSLTANTINIGDTTGAGADALNLSNQVLSNLAVQDLLLNSHGAINFYGDVGHSDGKGHLTPIVFNNLVLDAAALSGFDSADKNALKEVKIQADNLTIENSQAASVAQTGTGTGTLDLKASQYMQGSGTVGMDGFNTVNINVDNQLTATGNGVLNVASNLNLTAAAITTTAGHKLAINADGVNGNVVISGNANTTSFSSKEFGGAVAVSANSITLDSANVLLPSGSLSLQAKTGDVLVEGQSTIDLAGTSVNYGGHLVYTPGGIFSATAASGKINLGANTVLDISQGGGSAAGGALNLSAPVQSVQLDGTIKASGASASIDVSTYAASQGFDSLMNKLMLAGVSDKLYFRVHNDDITQAHALPATPLLTNTLAANSITLVADKGAIDISGTLNADRANNGGTINLAAGGEITLENGSLLTAKVTDINNGGKGGVVSLSSVDSLVAGHSGINIATGSTIDVSGSNASTGGTVTLSALRTGGTSNTPDTGINIQPIAGNVKGYSHFNAIGVKKYANADLLNSGSLSDQDIANINADTANYMNAAAQNVATALGAGITLRPGVEIDYKGDLTLVGAWDLSSQRFGQNSDPGSLIIAASGNLNVANSVTDGFSAGALQTGESWSLQMVAGADQDSADKFATVAAKDLSIDPGASIHTGTGDINLAAGGNIILTDQTSTIYSAGQSSGVGKTNPANASYPINGGKLVVHAGDDIIGAASKQFLSGWLTTQYAGVSRGKTTLTAWGVDASKFQQNIGSFGGGNVDINAARNITDLSVMMPVTGKQTVNGLQIQGDGNMQVKAGDDIVGGAYFLGMGSGSITAGGQIKGSAKQFTDGPQIVMSGDQSGQQTVAAGNGDTHLALNANQGIQVSAVSDAMMLPKLLQGFYTYTENSGISFNSLSGDIHLGANTAVVDSIIGISNADQRLLTEAYPGSLSASALNGSVILDSNIALFPSRTGTVDIFAKQNISSVSGGCATSAVGAGVCSIVMLDANPANLPNALQPLKTEYSTKLAEALFNVDKVNTGQFPLTDPFTNSVVHAATPLHGADKLPARLVTQSGDISSVYINMPKQAIIQAGRDLINSPIQIQHSNATDASIISAGRDLLFTAAPDSNGAVASNSNQSIQIAGPGEVLVQTGRNLNLGASVGIETVGNLNNSNLSGTGAALNIVVGLNGGKTDYNGSAPNYVAFIDKYLQANPVYADSLSQVKTLVTGFMRQRTGDVTLSDSAAMTAFRKLTSNETLPIQAQLNGILAKVFFNELKISGSAAALSKTAGYSSGYTAINTLFSENQWQGDLTMDYSKIQTVVGGDINLMVPGGKVNAGLAVAPSGTGAKSSDELGVVAQAQGEINAFVKDDFAVNTSRVFTLGGGDILIWSTDGNIDAGKGAKSALAVTVNPPYFDAQTHQLVVPAPTITNGSGIRTAAAPGATPGNVYLFAPKGVVNAGEAGIAGTNVTIAATAVLGAQNIQVSGIGTGVPQASAGSLAAGLTGTSNLSAGVTQMAQSTLANNDDEDKKEKMKNTVLGMLSVEVLGFGE